MPRFTSASAGSKWATPQARRLACGLGASSRSSTSMLGVGVPALAGGHRLKPGLQPAALGLTADYGTGVLGASTPWSFSVLTVFVFKSTTRIRWALVSATYILPLAILNPPGSLNSGPASQPSGSPPSSVVHER